MHTNEEFTPVPHQHEKRFLEEATEGPPAKRQPPCAPGDGFQNVCSDVKESPSSKTPIIVTQLKQLRLPVPCPVPTKFTKDVANAIKNNQLKGIMKTRLLRQAATFYWGLCPWPTHDEYVTMAVTLCDKFPQLKDKKPLHGQYWVSRSVFTHFCKKI